MSNDNYYVYVHTNIVNGKQYCGITSQNPKHRWRSDGSGYPHNKHLHSAIEKYGWDSFNHEIIHYNVTHDEANRLEKAFIAEHNLTNPNYGYNQTDGGDGTLGYRHSEETKRMMAESQLGHITSPETKKKISLANSGELNGMYGKTPWDKGQQRTQETKEKISQNRSGITTGENHPMYGKHHSEYTRKIISESNKGKTAWNKGLKTGITPSNAKRVGKYDNDGALIDTYPSISAAAKSINGYTSSIIRCCQGKSQYAGGFSWKYIKD